ncbi:MAG: hypothetical protein D6775_07295 [Caldilineae bacterium]|nr:MAG: hypothetical protein D6775_07295 [Caldilineae bacterium]
MRGPTGDRRRDFLALVVMAVAVLLLYGKVFFTNLVPAAGDFLYYFVPYWDYVNETLRAGRLPLWNPYLFAGAPLLANPQAQVFYPLRWLFIPFAAEKGILYFAALHAWLAGVFTYILARRGLRLGSVGSLVAGLIFALNGWVTGLLPHPVQWAAVPWLPAALLLWEMRPAVGSWHDLLQRPARRWLVAMTAVWTLTLLAGHTQMFYNQAVIFAAWALLSALSGAGRRYPVAFLQGLRTAEFRRHVLAEVRALLLLMVPVFALALLAAACQVLPTLELTRYSYRSGGLPFRDHAALSLPPWQLGFSLLPHYGRDMGQALASDAYSEWLAYVGLVGLVLALVGLAHRSRQIRLRLAVLTLGGTLLAMGAYNPLNYLLYRLVPGWSLFRVPARWLEAVVLGLALLGALGTEHLYAGRPLPRVRDMPLRGRLPVGVGITLALILAATTRPNAATLAGWALTLLILAGVLAARARLRRWGVILLVGVLWLELYAASWALPVQHPTAPQAIRSWRTAPARIAAENRPECRTLSLSTLTYDPGDLSDLRLIYGSFLDRQALDEVIVATKSKEILAPNLGLLFRLPSLDGFGGGVLPTRLFVRSMELFLPPERLVADGRLREQLHEVPDARLLSLLGVCYVIADKTFDVWHDDVYYDLAFGEFLTSSRPELTLSALPAFPVTSVGLVTYLDGGADLPDGTPVAELVAESRQGEIIRRPIRAGMETAAGPDHSPGLAHTRDLPHVRWRFNAPGQDTIAALPLPTPMRLARISLRLLDPDVRLFVRGLALQDGISGAHATIPVSRHPWRRIHSGDVKIYRNDGVMAVASVIPFGEVSPDDGATLATLRDPAFDPRERVLLADGPVVAEGGRGDATVEVLSPEHIRVRARANAAAILLVANAWYPGWHATVDGEPAVVRRADLLLQAIAIPAGQHEVDLRFVPVSLLLGEVLSLLTLVLLILLFFWRDGAVLSWRRRGDTPRSATQERTSSGPRTAKSGPRSSSQG